MRLINEEYFDKTKLSKRDIENIQGKDYPQQMLLTINMRYGANGYGALEPFLKYNWQKAYKKLKKFVDNCPFLIDPLLEVAYLFTESDAMEHYYGQHLFALGKIVEPEKLSEIATSEAENHVSGDVDSDEFCVVFSIKYEPNRKCRLGYQGFVNEMSKLISWYGVLYNELNRKGSSRDCYIGCYEIDEEGNKNAIISEEPIKNDVFEYSRIYANWFGGHWVDYEDDDILIDNSKIFTPSFVSNIQKSGDNIDFNESYNVVGFDYQYKSSICLTINETPSNITNILDDIKYITRNMTLSDLCFLTDGGDSAGRLTFYIQLPTKPSITSKTFDGGWVTIGHTINRYGNYDGIPNRWEERPDISISYAVCFCDEKWQPYLKPSSIFDTEHIQKTVKDCIEKFDEMKRRRRV